MSIAGPARRELNLSDLVSDQESQNSGQDFYDPEKETPEKKKGELAQYIKEDIEDKLMPSHREDNMSEALRNSDAEDVKSLEIIFPNYYKIHMAPDKRLEYAHQGVEQTRLSGHPIDWQYAPHYLSLMRILDSEAVEAYRAEIDLASINREAQNIENIHGMDGLVIWLGSLKESFPDIDFLNDIDFIKNLPWDRWEDKLIKSLESASSGDFPSVLETLASWRIVFPGKKWPGLKSQITEQVKNVLENTFEKGLYLGIAVSLKILTAQEVRLTDKGLELIMPPEKSYKDSVKKRPVRINDSN